MECKSLSVVFFKKEVHQKIVKPVEKAYVNNMLATVIITDNITVGWTWYPAIRQYVRGFPSEIRTMLSAAMPQPNPRTSASSPSQGIRRQKPVSHGRGSVLFAARILEYGQYIIPELALQAKGKPARQTYVQC